MSYSHRPVAGRGVEIKDNLSEYLVVDRPVKVRRPTGADRIDCAAIGDPLQAFDRERVNGFARSFGVQQHRARRIISHQPRKRANAN